MTRKTRLNVIIAGAFLAAFGLIFAWATLGNATGVGLSLYAALGGRRLR